jgi:hypothetical protein
MALSYRWGDQKRLLTSRTTYHSFRDHLPIGKMPRTFKNAIYITHMLKIKHLWIDALCIIQDDDEDLAREIEGMGNIYRNSILTLSAQSALSADDRLLVQRDPRWHRPCRLEMSTTAQDGTVTGIVYITSSVFEENHLQTRGWVLQEEVLSSRSLIFGSRMMSWNCTISQASESFPAMKSKDISMNLHTPIDRLRLWTYSPRIMAHAEKRHALRLNHLDAWYSAITNFSERQLIYDSDTLPALAGLASLFCYAHQITYLSGLWKEDLQVGLAWYVSHGAVARRFEGNRSPSAPT